MMMMMMNSQLVNNIGVMKINLDDVLTLNEASKIYGVPTVTIRQACTGQRGTPPRFTAEECRKSENVWLVTRSGMERLYKK